MRILFFLFLILSLAPTSASAASIITQKQTPQTANIFLPWKIKSTDIKKLSAWDIIILDAEVGAAQPELIKKIRAQNKSIKIFAYVSAIELHPLTPELFSESKLRSRLHARISPADYLYKPDGTHAIFWKPNHILNVTSGWKNTLPNFIAEEIISTGLWDGIMLDNVWDGITWYVGDVDANVDSIADDADLINAAWRESMQEMIYTIKSSSPKTLIIANGNPSSFKGLDGIVFENFPKHGWLETYERIKKFRANTEKNPIIILNTTTQGSLNKPLKTLPAFGLGSALLFDAHHSFSKSDTSHASLERIIEYNKKIGQPLGQPYEIAPTIWKRDFTKGSVIVNYGLYTATFELK